MQYMEFFLLSFRKKKINSIQVFGNLNQMKVCKFHEINLFIGLGKIEQTLISVNKLCIVLSAYF